MARRKQTSNQDAKPQLNFKAKHPEQLRALDQLEENTITFLCGPAGTAKSFIATYYALLRQKRIIIARPAITSGRDTGYKPGTVEQKLEPFLIPIFEAAEKLTGYNDRSVFEVMSLEYVRGRTIENATLIVDEAQNLTGKEFMEIMTRIGDEGKIIFCGDSYQHDIRESMIDQVAETYDGLSRGGERIGMYKFSRDAIVRSPLIAAIIDAYESAPWNRPIFD